MTNVIDHVHGFCFGPCNNSLYLFPCIQIGYVISLHRLRIGGGEIQRSKGEEGQNKEDQ